MVFISFFLSSSTPLIAFFSLSLHDALPIWFVSEVARQRGAVRDVGFPAAVGAARAFRSIHRQQQMAERSEEHTSELQSPCNLVCRLLLEKKKKEKGSSLIKPIRTLI